MKKNVILKGTLILTISGLISRLLGFYYRIFLTKAIGSEGLGLYQMVFPLIAVCMAIASSGISMAISRFTALYISQKKTQLARNTLILGMGLSLSIAIFCTCILYNFADFIAVKILMNAQSTSLVRIIAFTIPLSVIHSSINSYYIGKNNTLVPAVSQLIEQFLRIGSVFFIYKVQLEKGLTITAATGMLGLLCGEIGSCLFCLSICSFTLNDFKIAHPLKLTKDIFKMSVPISTNRITLSLLHSMEAILIPFLLTYHGLSTSESLSTYGVMSGMAFPLVMLPSTLINSFSTMLLPAVSGSSGQKNTISRTIHTALECSMFIGIFCLGAFLVWGNDAGNLLFNEPQVGVYVTAFAWMCPFLYISTTFSSILNGLGKTSTTLLLDISAFTLRIVLIALLIPKTGVTGYLIAFLISEVYLALICIFMLNRLYPISFDAFRWIIQPVISLVIASGVSLYFEQIFHTELPDIHPMITLLTSGIIMILIYSFFQIVFFRSKN